MKRMKASFDRNKAYLVCLYFSMSFFYLSYVLGEEDPVPLLGYILALITFIIISHDALLQFIKQVTEEYESKGSKFDVAALAGLTRDIADFPPAGQLLEMVGTALRELVGARKVHWLVSRELLAPRDGTVDTGSLKLQAWPARAGWSFHDTAFETFMADKLAPLTVDELPQEFRQACQETGTNLLLPARHAGRLCCVLLLELPAGEERPDQAARQALADMAGILAGKIAALK